MTQGFADGPASIIRADYILGSVHLLPRYGGTMPEEWNSLVLEQCNSFYVNPFARVDSYLQIA
jgi:hypothetical protein